MNTVDLIISINVHEKVDFLLKQLSNIEENVKISYAIVLNCNDYMFNELKDLNLENVYLNPIIINKTWNHGTLALGIYENIKYALKNFNFKIFLVMSSREFFYRNLTSVDQIRELKILDTPTLNTPWTVMSDYNVNNWGWPLVKTTLLFNKIKSLNLKFSQSPHEGMAFEESTLKFILEFIDHDEELKTNLFNFNAAMEEWALQSIAVNHLGYYYIGNGCYNKTPEESDKQKFTHKLAR